MATKVKLEKETEQKADAVMAHHGYSSLEEMVADLIGREYQQIQSGEGNKEELASKLSGLGYIS